jgi:7-carboxy-7-deazaguanine synthase
MQVHKIFVSLSGEPDGFGNQGGLATFVRLQGCNLSCRWCDTDLAATNDNIAQEMKPIQILAQCQTKHVIITGGEPLLQRLEIKTLINLLDHNHHCITIETNGSQVPIKTHSTVRFVVDYKLTTSGMTEFMWAETFDSLTSKDVIKFVMSDLFDYRQACKLIKVNPHWAARKVFSPVAKHSNWPAILAKQMIEDKVDFATLSLQLHKLLTIQ